MAGTPYHLLKLYRAQRHLDEIKSLVAPYELPHTYLPVRDVQSDPDPRVFRYRAQLLAEPDDDLTLAVGDFVVNVRSALDHLVHELRGGGPRHPASAFPILDENIWHADPTTGDYDRGTDGARKRFMKCLPGVPEPAIEIIKRTLPSIDAPDGGIPRLHYLNQLANADKHGDVFSVLVGIADPTTTMVLGSHLLTVHASGTADGQVLVAEYQADDEWLTEYTDDRIIRKELLDRMLHPSQPIEVRISGQPRIALSVPDPPGSPVRAVGIPQIFDEIIDELIENVFGPLNTFI